MYTSVYFILLCSTAAAGMRITRLVPIYNMRSGESMGKKVTRKGAGIRLVVYTHRVYTYLFRYIFLNQ